MNSVIRNVFLQGFIVTTLLACSPSPTAGAQTAATNNFHECVQFFANGKIPVFQTRSPANLRALCYDAFAILHSGVSKTPVYVAERINKAELLDALGEKRSNRFFSDARLPLAERAVLDDYKGSGYARGHMAPAGDMANPQTMAQSFSLANMVPQAPHNNQGPWAGIEKATRKYAMRAQGDVYVITGPVFDQAGGETIGAGRVMVPRYLFKLVYDAESKRAWAHWMENTDEARAGRPIDYAELVKRTGIEFLPGLTVLARDGDAEPDIAARPRRRSSILR